MENNLEKYELKKGDADFLEGRVFSYCHLKPSSLGPEFPAVFYSHKLDDIKNYLVETFNSPHLLEICPISRKVGFTYYGTATTLNDLTEIPKIEGDVLFAGDIEDIFNASNLLDDAVTSYMKRHLEQLDASEDASDYHGTEFVKKLWKYVWNLSRAFEERDDKARRKELELERFMRNSFFLPEIAYLINVAKKRYNNLGLINAFVETAGAFHDCDSEKMERNLKKLKEML